MSMDSREDFNIQELLDQNLKDFRNINAENTQDLKAYKKLYTQLAEQLDEGLPLSFKSNVLRQIEAVKKQADDSRFYWLLGLVITLGVTIMGVTAYFFSDVLIPYYEVLNKFKGFILIGIFAVLSFNYLEKKFSES